MKPQGIIFDLDGVIVDTARFHYIAWKDLAAELGFDFNEKDNERLKGVSRMRSLEILLELGGIQVSEEEKLKLAEKKNNHYRQLIETLTPEDILPGAKQFLYEVKDAGIKVALGSASKNAMTILKNIGLAYFFDAVVDGTKVTKAKPDPEVFLIAAKEMGTPPEETIVFEDALAGIEAAHNAGMFAIGVGDKNTLSPADYVIPGFQNFTLDKLMEVYNKK